MSDRVLRFVFDCEEPQRLDHYLVTRLPEFSRSRLQGLIKDGFVTINEKQVTKAGAMLEEGMEVEIHIPPAVSTDLVPEEIPLEIIFENDDLILVNKPAGMVVHPAAGHFSGTLVHAALAHAPDLEGIGGEIRPGVVHRLDKDTSGLILLAKNEHTQQALQDQFRLRQVKKTYIALVDGLPPTPKGRVEAPIGRDPSHRKQMAVVTLKRGREAVTEYFTLEKFPKHTLIEAHPLTGRTHQIRLHLAFLGCPIVADTIYGYTHPSLPLTRHFLHAARINFTLPGEKEPRTFEAPLPPDLSQILDDLRKSH